MPVLLFHSDPKTTLPPPSPISILAVPAWLYLLYFSILLAYAAAFVPPQHTSLLLLWGSFFASFFEKKEGALL